MRMFLIAVWAACYAFAAHAGPKIEHWQAPSGARVYFVETHALPILDIAVDFAAGSAYDPPGKAGLAALSHGLLDGGAGPLDEEAIAGKLVDIGAQLGGSLDNDRAGVKLRTLAYPAERDAALDLLELILSRPLFPESVVVRERGRTVAAIQDAETRPDHIASRRFAERLYPNHPYGTLATADSVARLGRDDLVEFYRTHYSAAHAVVSIVGDLSRTEAERIAQRLTGALPPSSGEVSLPPVTLPAGEVLKIAHPAAQSHIHIGIPAVRRADPDYFALLVGNYILGGGGFVSRLVKEIREKRGYAYSVYSTLAPYGLAGPFDIGLQTKREQADDAIATARRVLADFVSQGPTPAELAAAKKNLIDGQALRIDSNAKLLGYLEMIGFYGLPLTYLDDFPDRIRQVSVDQVKAAFARRIDAERLVTVIVAAD